MLADLQLILWLHWRQLQRTTTYWLRVVGFDPLEETTSNRIYGVYLILIFAGWIILMWSLAVHEALFVGKKIPVADRTNVRSHFLTYAPWLATVAVILLVILAIRKTPLKLSVEDLAYIAATPIRRDAIGVVGFAGYSLIGMAVTVPLVTLTSMMLAHPNSRDELGVTAYPAILTSIPLVLVVAAIAWCFGFWRLSRYNAPRFAWIWPVLLIGLSVAFPPLMTWPGYVLARAVLAESMAFSALGLLFAAIVLVAGVIWIGGRINLITVSAELGTTSQLKSLGVLGRFVWRDLSRQMRDRDSLARHTPHFALPNATGVWMLIGRAGLIFMRQPFRFVATVLRGASFVAAGVWLASIGSPALAWLVWLSIVMLTPTREVLGVYSADQSNAFLRQFLGYDNLELLVIDALLPAVLMSVIGMIGWVLLIALGIANPLTVPLMVSFTAMMILSQGAALVRAPGGDPTVGSLLYTGLSFGITLLLAEFVGPVAALISSAVAIWALSAIIGSSSRFSAAAFSND